MPLKCQRCRGEFNRFSMVLSILLALLLIVSGGPITAGEVHLKNGTVITGKPLPIQSLNSVVRRQAGELQTFPMLLIDTGMQRYFVPNRQVDDINRDADLSLLEKFKLKQQRQSNGKMLKSVGRFREVTPFDEYGRRRVTLTINKKSEHIIQGITEIGPEYLKVIGLNHTWTHGIATTSVSPPILDKMIRQVTDQQKPNDRLAIASFFVQAGMYPQAQKELEAIETDFPEFKKRIEELTFELRTLLAKRLLAELRQRRTAGQHFLAYSAAKRFPTRNMSATVLREVREMITHYDDTQQQATKALLRLGEIQAQLDNPKQLKATMPLRSEIREQLNYVSLDRLEAFLKLESDDSLTPAEKLALAYSGWVVGSANAVTDLDTTVRLWQARFLILEYLRLDDPMKRRLTIVKLQNLESIGPNTISQLISLLPPAIESPNVKPGQIATIEVTDPNSDSESEIPIQYSVLLPPEYSPFHRYPMVVALRSADRTAQAELIWWGGTAEKPTQSQRHGYIVIAPEYKNEGQHKYDYSPVAHHKILQSIRDARKRFNVDSDRIFLSGHGIGGDAAFDIGMSHPDIFAGIMPITGVSDMYCKHYRGNAKRLGWYIVAGEYDGNKLERNARDLNRMLRGGYDVIYSEYIGRGYESYYAEIHKLFDWMEFHQREPLPKEFEFNILRSTDNHFYWIQLDGLPKNVTQAVLTTKPASRVRPMIFKAKVSDGSDDRTVIHIMSGAGKNTLWLSPQMIDFDKRLQVRHNGRQKYNDFIPAGIEAIEPMLQDFRIRGDRQRLFWAKIEL